MRHIIFLAALAACTPRMQRDDGTPSGPSTVSVAPAARETTSPARSTMPVASSPTSQGDVCARLFDPPNDGELLCDEHVMAQDAEIHWRSFGLAAARVEVNDRYHTPAARCRFGLTFKPPLFDVTDGERRLETFDASEHGYPTCSKGPSPAHRTVLVLSERYRR